MWLPLTNYTMSQREVSQIRQQVKERALAKIRLQWFRAYRADPNAARVCRQFGISRSQFYYWKRRLDLPPTGRGQRVSRAARLLAYSRRPATNPRMYTPEVVALLCTVRRRTKRGAETIGFLVRDKYGLTLSVTGIYKTLKRAGLIRARRTQRRKQATYEAPAYLPGEKVQVDAKYVRLHDAAAQALGKPFRWVYQYTALDVATGIKCKWIYATHDPDACIDFLQKLRRFYPFPVQCVQTDNGSEFTWRLQPEILKLHPFDLLCQLLHVQHVCIPPAYPRSNSHVERTHRTDEEEVYRGRTFTSLAQLHRVTLRSLRYFNERRPQKRKQFLAPLQYAILKFRLQKQKLHYAVLDV